MNPKTIRVQGKGSVTQAPGPIEAEDTVTITSEIEADHTHVAKAD